MHITLSPETEKFIESQIKQGGYSNASEIIEAYMQSMIEFRQQVDAAIQEGINDIEAGRFSTGREAFEEIKAAITKRD